MANAPQTATFEQYVTDEQIGEWLRQFGLFNYKGDGFWSNQDYIVGTEFTMEGRIVTFFTKPLPRLRCE